MTRILLVDDHEMLANALGDFLVKEINAEIWASVRSGEAALEQLAAAAGNLPDLAMMDISLPQMSGFDLVGELHQQYPDLPCLVLTGHYSIPYVQQALDRGARGFVAKGNPPAIVEAIQQILSGEIYLSDEARSHFSEEKKGRAANDNFSSSQASL